jgi:hypothetical protein
MTTTMTETLFPTRQRCKKCGKKLGADGAHVLLGLYCEAKCASMAPIAKTPEEAPRECKTQRAGRWEFKRRYRSESEIPQRLREDPSANWYVCNNSCGALHIGHSRINLATESHRVLGDRGALTDLLIKSRGKATIRQVATVAGIRPIRLKELEDPNSEKVDLNALFAVLATYHIKMSAVLRDPSK